MNKKVYRDWDRAVGHDSNTSYDHGIAGEQMMMTIKRSVDFTDTLGVETVRMQKAYDVMYNKAHTKRKLTISDVYKDYPDVGFDF